MKRVSIAAAIVIVATGISVNGVASRMPTDSSLRDEIRKIRAIDNHAQPRRLTLPDDKQDDEWDALPLEAYLDFIPPVRLRSDNIEYLAAWRELYGYAHQDASVAHVRELIVAKTAAMKERGDGYPAWVLDQVGVDVMFANRVAMGRGLSTPRFRWVPYVDALLFPFSTAGIQAAMPRFKLFYDSEEKLLWRYVRETGLRGVPPTLNQYLEKVLRPTLERQRRDGAVAVKFEIAYLRSIRIEDVPATRARAIYSRFILRRRPSGSEYRLLQDFLFRQIAREAGRLGLAVHIHVAWGAGAQFELSGSNPLPLDSMLNDPVLQETNFVIVHGGWPFTKETAVLMNKPNVYADFSAQTFLLYPRALSAVLRDWLELYPEKVLFGTDAAPLSREISWEETAWVTSATAREALTMALSGMIEDGEITRERALELARMVLRENAMKLYRIATG